MRIVQRMYFVGVHNSKQKEQEKELRKTLSAAIEQLDDGAIIDAFMAHLG